MCWILSASPAHWPGGGGWANELCELPALGLAHSDISRCKWLAAERGAVKGGEQGWKLHSAHLLLVQPLDPGHV